MIDLTLLRENPEQIKKLILKKEPTFKVDELIKLDKQLRSVRSKIEDLRKTRNELAKKGAKGITDEVRAQSIALGKEIKSEDKQLEETEKQFKLLALSCPNVPQDDVHEGGKELNKVVETIGKKPEFSFTPKNHVELNEKLDWFDFDAATRMAGNNFVLYKKDSVKLMYALTNLMIRNNVKHGFEPILPPYLVNEKSLVNSGNLPKFEGDFYKMSDDDLCLIPTAEVNLTNLYADKILNAEELPIRHAAWTSCFRREAGGYGANERGLIRIHQFEKVETYSICEPKKSNEELDKMLVCAQDLLKQLGLHYQISLLAAQDCSFASAKTFDIEVWLPGQQKFYEVSSCSNCTDFQSRRAKIRYRKKADAKPELAHTLNASSLALPRLMVAVMEQYQTESGEIKFPKVLQDAMNNVW
jgi:seryl-tRNA synthetase